METLKLEIVTPKGSIFNGEVKSITLPGSEGEFGVLPGHASLLTLLRTGVIDIEKSDGKHDLVAISSGYAEVDESSVTILADGAVYVGGDGESEIANSLKKIEDLLDSIKSDPFVAESVLARVKNIKTS